MTSRSKRGVLIVPRGKNNKRRVMPLSPGVIKDLDDYLNEVRIYENTKESQSFILNQRGRRMQKDTYNRILKNDHPQNSK
ncbi:MAG: tyrosine-type recombinase/integrase [Saprospiraceae bacterium]|nr:tyrosine-type recombinase/integrase [Candidatus Vicinibacter affinis]